MPLTLTYTEPFTVSLPTWPADSVYLWSPHVIVVLRLPKAREELYDIAHNLAKDLGIKWGTSIRAKEHPDFKQYREIHSQATVLLSKDIRFRLEGPAEPDHPVSLLIEVSQDSTLRLILTYDAYELLKWSMQFVMREIEPFLTLVRVGS